MDTGDWITLAAVLVALAIGVASILHTQRLQKKERRERLLNEVIEWAIDLTQSTYGRDIKMVTLTDKEFATAIHVNVKQLNTRGKYIVNMVVVFDKRLAEVVDEAISNLEACEKATLDLMKNITDKKKLKIVVDKGQKLGNTASKVIEEATKLKIQDIS
jgi:hypothetical protein